MRKAAHGPNRGVERLEESVSADYEEEAAPASTQQRKAQQALQGGRWREQWPQDELAAVAVMGMVDDDMFEEGLITEMKSV